MASPLKIRFYDDPVLRQKTDTIGTVGAAERVLINAMIETMHEEKGIGLAAPQVGINQKIFVVDIGDGPLVFINPQIVKKSGEAEMEEGCLSIPGVNINVKRPAKILIKYVDENNEEQEKMFDDLLARVIQHENDHLNGTLIIDYASDEDLERIGEALENLKKGTVENKKEQ